ncbi:MAG TPA: hypothetical protein DIT13_10660 [Verrucomicrobiales bacterium]|nr:hypothetical protein [Verrucomicrobiales bacterium]HRJ07144.1 hypothetical protein [Prosthecobacter sp.]HRK13347.1 hypothetical protein [Prosthecobacter sp.]
MKRFLLSLLVLITLGLCAVCALQWQREHRLRARISDLTRQLAEENKRRVEFEEKAMRYEQEIARVTTLRAQTEAALLEATETLQQTASDQMARGHSIAVLSSELLRARAESAALRELASQGTSAIQQRNETVAGQNAAIEKANARLRELAKERDDAIQQLNARTREFNALVEKYNALAKGSR